MRDSPTPGYLTNRPAGRVFDALIICGLGEKQGNSSFEEVVLNI